MDKKDKIKKEADKAEQSTGQQNTVYTDPCEFYKVKFQVNSTAFLNKQEEKKFYDLLDKKINAFSVVDLTGYASEEGDADDNLRLSENRMLQIEKLIRSKHPGVTIKKSAKGEQKGSYEENRCVELCISASPSIQNIYSYRWANAQSNVYSGPKITEGYWSDKNGNKVTHLDPTNRPFIHLKTTGIEKGEMIYFNIYDSDLLFEGDDEVLSMFGTVNEQGEVFVRLPEGRDIYDLFEDISELYFTADFETDKHKIFGSYPKNSDDYLKCMIVAEIPSIMSKMGWDMSSRYMERWFSSRPRNNNPDPGREPVYGPREGLANMEWLLQWEKARLEYERLMANVSLWTSEKAIQSMGNQILQMNEDDVLQWPEIGTTVPFGVTAIRFVEDGGKRVPLFHKYQFNHQAFVQPKSLDVEPDDLYGSYGDFSFMLIPFGTITGAANGSVRVRLERIGVYTYDVFDFSNFQYLGHWSLTENDVKLVFGRVFGEGSYHYIENEDFRAWRDVTKRGRDYSIYSDIRFFDIEPVEFILPINR